MNRTISLLSITLVVMSHGPSLQAQLPSNSTHADTPDLVERNASSPVGQVSDDPDSANTIRIVRLSQANGKVEMDRNIGRGFEAAFNNLPITQSSRLKTSAGSAEVEFEDGTTLRLIPETQVDFTQLSRTATGSTISSMNVLSGTVYVSLNKTKGNTFRLNSGDGVITPRPGSHFRLEIKASESRLSVISGSVDFMNTSGSREVGKMKSLIFNTETHASADLIAGIEDAPFDSWDEQQTEYHQRYYRGNALAGSGVSYGLADLNYYGAFSDVDGCGRIWRPYFTSATWDPYSSGIWTLYPGSGYSWVSPYPWGWAPFHYGSWLQCGGAWGWQPGGSWYGLTVRAPYRDHDRHHFGHDPSRIHPFPPQPHPISGKASSMIAINEKPLKFSHVDRATGSFNFRNDSAGLGVPRGEFGKLNKLSETANKAGSSNVPVFFTPTNRNDLPSSSHISLAARDGKGSETRLGGHAGTFDRPNTQNRETHNNSYAERSNGSGYSRSSAANTNGYSSTSRAGGYAGYSGGGNGYSGSSHVGGGNYSGGARTGGGYTGPAGGGPHISAPASVSAPSAPTSSSSAGHH